MADIPQRIQRNRTKGWRMPPNTVSVTRPGRWGNPFGNVPLLVQYPNCADPVKIRGKSLFAADAFRMWLKGDLDIPKLFNRRQWILGNAHTLAGKNLACWCGPGMPCHADVLLEIANAPEARAA